MFIFFLVLPSGHLLLRKTCLFITSLNSLRDNRSFLVLRSISVVLLNDLLFYVILLFLHSQDCSPYCTFQSIYLPFMTMMRLACYYCFHSKSFCLTKKHLLTFLSFASTLPSHTGNAFAFLYATVRLTCCQKMKSLCFKFLGFPFVLSLRTS